MLEITAEQKANSEMRAAWYSQCQKDRDADNIANLERTKSRMAKDHDSIYSEQAALMDADFLKLHGYTDGGVGIWTSSKYEERLDSLQPATP